jgi:hypothetical protein
MAIPSTEMENGNFYEDIYIKRVLPGLPFRACPDNPIRIGRRARGNPTISKCDRTAVEETAVPNRAAPIARFRQAQQARTATSAKNRLPGMTR